MQHAKKGNEVSPVCQIILSTLARHRLLALGILLSGCGAILTALVPPLVLALLWHFAVWPVTLRLGRSGMGLALCQRIAAVHGGTLQISSQVGVGTAVTVTLPKEVQP